MNYSNLSNHSCYPKKSVFNKTVIYKIIIYFWIYFFLSACSNSEPEEYLIVVEQIENDLQSGNLENAHLKINDLKYSCTIEEIEKRGITELMMAYYHYYSGSDKDTILVTTQQESPLD